MSHTIIEMFVKVVPVDLFRSGSINGPNLHKLRTMPPRTIEQSFDVQIYVKNGISFVSKDTGGISTFDKIRPGIGNYWWKIPKGTKIPAGLRISRDSNQTPSSNPTHYTIRPQSDMPLTRYIRLLQELALFAEMTFDASFSKKNRS